MNIKQLTIIVSICIASLIINAISNFHNDIKKIKKSIDNIENRMQELQNSLYKIENQVEEI